MKLVKKPRSPWYTRAIATMSFASVLLAGALNKNVRADNLHEVPGMGEPKTISPKKSKGTELLNQHLDDLDAMLNRMSTWERRGDREDTIQSAFNNLKTMHPDLFRILYRTSIFVQTVVSNVRNIYGDDVNLAVREYSSSMNIPISDVNAAREAIISRFRLKSPSLVTLYNYLSIGYESGKRDLTALGVRPVRAADLYSHEPIGAVVSQGSGIQDIRVYNPSIRNIGGPGNVGIATEVDLSKNIDIQSAFRGNEKNMNLFTSSFEEGYGYGLRYNWNSNLKEDKAAQALAVKIGNSLDAITSSNVNGDPEFANLKARLKSGDLTALKDLENMTGNPLGPALKNAARTLVSITHDGDLIKLYGFDFKVVVGFGKVPNKDGISFSERARISLGVAYSYNIVNMLARYSSLDPKANKITVSATPISGRADLLSTSIGANFQLSPRNNMEIEIELGGVNYKADVPNLGKSDKFYSYESGWTFFSVQSIAWYFDERKKVISFNQPKGVIKLSHSLLQGTSGPMGSLDEEEFKVHAGNFALEGGIMTGTDVGKFQVRLDTYLAFLLANQVVSENEQYFLPGGRVRGVLRLMQRDIARPWKKAYLDAGGVLTASCQVRSALEDRTHEDGTIKRGYVVHLDFGVGGETRLYNIDGSKSTYIRLTMPVGTSVSSGDLAPGNLGPNLTRIGFIVDMGINF